MPSEQPVLTDTENEIATFRHEDIHLNFTAEEYFVGDIMVSFFVYAVNDDGTTGAFKHSFREPIAVKKIPHKTDKVSGVEWNVHLRRVDLNHGTYRVFVKAQGKGESGKLLRSSWTNPIRVTEIVLTDDPALRAIMVHEFSIKDRNGKIVFDEKPLREVIRNLTSAQKHLLVNYDLKKRDGRLVVFATFQPSDPTHSPRYMEADWTNKAVTCVYANANMAVFACRPKKPPMLVCYTEHVFLYPTPNPDYWKAHPDKRPPFQRTIDGKAPKDWLDRNNPKPPRCVAASLCLHDVIGRDGLPTGGTDGVIWSRLFTPAGEDIMPGNSVHGMINTKGCWMLFRNYNWPVQDRDRMRAIYLHYARHGFPREKRSSDYLGTYNWYKFRKYDKNYAYNFFFRWIVGVKFFSKQAQYFSRANLYKTHGLEREIELPSRAKDIPQEFITGEDDDLKQGYRYYDVDMKHEPKYYEDDGASQRALDPPGDQDKHYNPENGNLWTKNKLGFQTAQGFMPGRWQGSLSKQQVEDLSWSDWYFFKPDDVSLSKALPVSQKAPDPPEKAP